MLQLASRRCRPLDRRSDLWRRLRQIERPGGGRRPGPSVRRRVHPCDGAAVPVSYRWSCGQHRLWQSAHRIHTAIRSSHRHLTPSDSAQVVRIAWLRSSETSTSWHKAQRGGPMPHPDRATRRQAGPEADDRLSQKGYAESVISCGGASFQSLARASLARHIVSRARPNKHRFAMNQEVPLRNHPAL